MRWLCSGLLLLFGNLLLHLPAPSLAHGGHSHEFEGGDSVDFSTDAIQVDVEIQQRLGLLVESVKAEVLEFGLRATGEIAFLPQGRVEVTSPVAGSITRLLVQPGETIQAGETVALLSSPELAAAYIEAQERRTEADVARKQAQAALQLAQDRYLQQRQLWSSDRTRLKTAVDVALDRTEKDRVLFENGTIAKQIWVESEAQLRAAQGELTQLDSRLSLNEAQAGVQQAQAALESAESRLALSAAPYQTRLRQLGVEVSADGTIAVAAPITGTVLEQEITLGESVAESGQALMAIADSQTVFVTANLHEKDITKISKGQRARVAVAGFPGRAFGGVVTVIGSTVTPETRTVPVQIEIGNPQGILKPGMFAELELLEPTATVERLTIPASAVLEIQGQSQVFVQNGQAFEAIDVGLGRVVGDRIEVLSGLFEGDRIVTQRANQLYAQSLRQGSRKSDEAHSSGDERDSGDKQGAESITAAQANSWVSLPWWTWATGGSFITVGAFLMGRAMGQATGRPPAYLEATSPGFLEGEPIEEIEDGSTNSGFLMPTQADEEVQASDA